MSRNLNLFDQPDMDLFDQGPPPIPAPVTDPAPIILQIPDGPGPGPRVDIHRPSAIDPADYVFVGHECIKILPGDIGAYEFLRAERDAIQLHMSNSGGTYSSHQHGGNCMVCGSVNAVYTILFHHAKSNTYVRMGADCAEKCYSGADFGAAAFRRRCDDVREAIAGKRKAQALLGDWGLSSAWELYTADYSANYQGWGRDEMTARDIVGKLVKYGSITDKTQRYLFSLMRAIDEKPTRAAARAAEAAEAANCPTGRQVVEGRVLTIRVDDSPYGPVTKMLVRHESGFKVWGTRPSGLDCERGDTVRFTATLEPSKDDPKFGFASRPTKAEVLSRASSSIQN